MTKRDGKSKFYRQLKLDKETSAIMKWYKKIVPDLINDKYQEEELNGEENSET